MIIHNNKTHFCVWKVNKILMYLKNIILKRRRTRSAQLALGQTRPEGSWPTTLTNEKECTNSSIFTKVNKHISKKNLCEVLVNIYSLCFSCYCFYCILSCKLFILFRFSYFSILILFKSKNSLWRFILHTAFRVLKLTNKSQDDY